MTTETAILLAIVAAPVAVVMLVLAMAVALSVRRVRRSVARSSDLIDGTTDRWIQEFRSGRRALGHRAAELEALRQRGRALDGDLERWAGYLTDLRTTVARVDQRRLSPAVRAMRWASVLGRVALVWRTPGR